VARKPTVSIEQREALDSMLRQSPLGVSGDVKEQRRLFQEMSRSSGASSRR
jgi:hypothetical protein